MRGCLRKAKISAKTERTLQKGVRKWDIILALGRRPDGKYGQKWVRFTGTKKEAERKLRDLTGEVDRGEFVEPSRLIAGTWFEEWLDKVVRPPRFAHNTCLAYRNVVVNHLKPAFGHLILQQITSLHVERYYTDAITNRLSARSQRLHRAVINRVFGDAVQSGILRQNVAERATNKPRLSRRSAETVGNVWSQGELLRFTAHVKNVANAQHSALFQLALDRGLRIGELLGLRWTDLEGSTLRVERQLLGTKRDKSTGTLTLVMPEPKRGSVRTIELSDETLTALREHRRVQAEVKLKNRQYYADHGLMFAQGWEHVNSKHAILGSPINRHSLSRRLRQLAAEAGVRRLTFHGLRHTCASVLLACGVAPHVVQRRLGHERVEMTLNLYAHVLPGQQAEAARELSRAMHG